MSAPRPHRDLAAPRRGTVGLLVALAVALVIGVLLGVWLSRDDAPEPTAAVPIVSSTPEPPVDSPEPSEPRETAPSEPATSPPAPEPLDGRHVVAVSIDGLSVDALRRLGPTGAPHLWRVVLEGASTLNARTEFEKTVTLPNHVGMITGRPVFRVNDGHGVTWNDDLPDDTVQAAAGEPVESIFTAVAGAGGTTAMFAGKSKFDVFADSWPDAVGLSTIDGDMAALTDAAVRDLEREHRSFTFVHLADADLAGHANGWMSQPYLDAVRAADTALGELIAAIETTPELSESTALIVTADHGGQGMGHGDPALPADYTIPFAVWGSGVRQGDLYDLAPDLTDPGTGRPGWADADPVRNCDVANVAARALDLDAVAGSRCVAADAMRRVFRG